MSTPGWFKRTLGLALSPVTNWLGAYNSTDPRRKILEKFLVQKATANQSLAGNLPTLVAQCRHLERNCPSARAISEGLVADIVGTGIDVAPDTGSESRDDKIRERWLDWAESAAVNGASLWELQAQAVRELVSAGSFLWRFVKLQERQAQGLLPLAILPLEVEWLSTLAVGKVAEGCAFISGIEVDKLGRPVAYHLLDPNFNGDVTKGERVEAKFICHGFEQRRPYQTHGEPMLAPVVERLKQADQLVTIELKSAEISQNFAVAIKSEYHPDDVNDGDDTDPVTDISPGTVTRLFPGEEAQLLQSTRPSQMIAPFLAMLRGDLASATRTARKWLDRDYSSATFMNTRMEQADSKRQHKATQNWLARHVATRPYLEVLPWLMLSSGQVLPTEGLAARKIRAHKILPDLPEYVDPLKDGEAALQNVNGNLSTLEEACSSRGKDWLKIAQQRAKENKILEGLGLRVDPAEVAAQEAAAVEAAKPEAPAEKPAKPKKSKPKPKEVDE